MRIGLDVGSTTLKCVVLDRDGEVVFHSYQRHYSQITQTTADLLQEVREKCRLTGEVQLHISGSAGMGLAQDCNIPFIQEVYATRMAIKQRIPDADAVIELGGEDAKILFLSRDMEVRMNGSCAGGTGAFIDQMATLLDITPEEMNQLAERSERVYTIASRCGVFAKSDIQPLINQGARKEDICASIFHAVVNQTVAGLAQGRRIEGKVIYLGGPLTFLPQLRKSFDETLHLEGICPEQSLYFVAIGAALGTDGQPVRLESVISEIRHYLSREQYVSSRPLFTEQAEYESFRERHSRAAAVTVDPKQYHGPAYLGIDAGSTTVKAVVLDPQNRILCSKYLFNSGNPVSIVREFLAEFYESYPEITITAAAATGYGEEIIQNAFRLDFGIVETVAHFTAAKKFQPDVDFIIDIGGQDIKCFQIHNGLIDNLYLNEACSSGCGSFLQTFAGALGYSVQEFAALGLFADRPVDLGSRCTVFMNSSVKQAQKDGATVENISAGLSISVVKNALYKVIRTSPDKLGEHIVVQGGTFLNDAVLRAFEQEIGRPVIRPQIAGLMGAYGAAVYAGENSRGSSGILDAEELRRFSHSVKAVTCGLCGNHCRLTVNTFDGGRKFIGGNRCERPLQKRETERLDLYEYKLELLERYRPIRGTRGKIGLPMGLNLYELLPFWHTFFTELGFEVVPSPMSSRELYIDGQQTIPSDTVCFPAKLIHGHIRALIRQGVKTIFYPCMTYNFEEKLGDNHFNCPVVAYYPEVIAANMQETQEICFLYPYLGLHHPRTFVKKIGEALRENWPMEQREIKRAAKAAYREQEAYRARIRQRGQEYLERARKEGRQIVILAGRPYHIDPEINHGIDRLICQYGAVVLSEDALSCMEEKRETAVLNQWTYHARLYAAARYVTEHPELNLIQLVSFGCGIDAITTDEVRSILESHGKIYTQIKIDEITNLGAVKIRLRSLFAAIEQEKKNR